MADAAAEIRRWILANVGLFALALACAVLLVVVLLALLLYCCCCRRARAKARKQARASAAERRHSGDGDGEAAKGAVEGDTLRARGSMSVGKQQQGGLQVAVKPPTVYVDETDAPSGDMQPRKLSRTELDAAQVELQVPEVEASYQVEVEATKTEVRPVRSKAKAPQYRAEAEPPRAGGSFEAEAEPPRAGGSFEVEAEPPRAGGSFEVGVERRRSRESSLDGGVSAGLGLSGSAELRAEAPQAKFQSYGDGLHVEEPAVQAQVSQQAESSRQAEVDVRLSGGVTRRSRKRHPRGVSVYQSDDNEITIVDSDFSDYEDSASGSSGSDDDGDRGGRSLRYDLAEADLQLEASGWQQVPNYPVAYQADLSEQYQASGQYQVSAQYQVSEERAADDVDTALATFEAIASGSSSSNSRRSSGHE